MIAGTQKAVRRYSSEYCVNVTSIRTRTGSGHGGSYGGYSSGGSHQVIEWNMTMEWLKPPVVFLATMAYAIARRDPVLDPSFIIIDKLTPRSVGKSLRRRTSRWL